MSNFQFLQSTWPDIYREAQEAESLTLISPKACAIICRSALEKSVLWLYANDPDLQEPYDTRLSALMHEQCFKDILKPSMFREIHLIRKFGNNAAHGKSISSEESLVANKNLYRFLSFLAIYYAEEEPQIRPFDESIIPTGKEDDLKLVELKQLEKKLEKQNEAARQEREKLEEQAKEIETLKAQLIAKEEQVKTRKEERAKGHKVEKDIPLLVSEALTRKLYIDQSLKESGWDKLREGYELEYEVKGMPDSTNPSGIGYVDYVLWGDDGKPLAVVEAKKTMADPRKGKQQAKLYADCLEQMYGQRPLIFYTNGFETYLWDDQFYPEREVSGFYTKNELQLAVDRRKDRLDLKAFRVNSNIAGRYYQLEAVKRVAETFCRQDSRGRLSGGARKALLVMATGSGKTRVAISIVDMLTKCYWVKRVLFLADRNALVSQAKRRFSEFLPNLSSIDLTKEKGDVGTRIVFSTYPTIMNKIDSVKAADHRFYGPGHFDLIIIDEAHRSVYQKYGAIFEYFDSLLIGLTATPKKEIDRNTYELFEIEDDNPSFAYELDQAVNDDYLVPPKAFNVPIKFPREGIKYHELTEREKQEYEEKFGDPSTGEVPDEIGSEALNSWLFNTGTVDRALEYLMEQGIKVQGGDKIGKTIIFAKNHQHALFIEKRFNVMFPEHKGDFLRVIDNHETKAQDLLERFCDEHEEMDPQIAVSVDMMDTGVDAPRVVNLVFFKAVKSYTKFWQMIGRGTRLCPDLFGPELDKEHFLIFDLCGNLEFFQENPEGVGGHKVKSLTRRIFELKLDLVVAIRDADHATDIERALAEQYADALCGLVKDLDTERFMVKVKLRYVIEYSNKSRWENLSKSDVLDIKTHLAGLSLPDKDDHELSRRFDILLLTLKLAMVTGGEVSKYIFKVGSIANSLAKKSNIPAVAAQIQIIHALQTEDFWKNTHVSQLEEVRLALRELMKFLDKESRTEVYTNLEDEIDEAGIKEHSLLEVAMTARPYRDRVEAYIRKNKHHETIQKLRSNQPINSMDLLALERMLFVEELGTKQDYVDVYGEQPIGVFIRSIVGLDIKAAKEAFAEFIQVGKLSANQMTFIDNIIMFLEKNGMIEPSMLFEPPFTDINDQGLLGVFDDAEAHRLLRIVEQINANALAA